MELKVGMYVRTKKGIAKILGRINDPTNFYHKMLITDKFLKIHGDTEYIHDLDIIKARKNITDLLQVGDYVNGYLVTFVYRPDGNEVFRIELEKNTLQGHIISKSEQIKSIVTKEQFESIKYEVNKDE